MATPTLDTLNGKLDNLAGLIEAIPAAVAAAIAGATPPPSVTPPAPADDSAAFILQFTTLDPVAFKAKFGREFKQPLPPLPAPYDPQAVLDYAQSGYNPQGEYVGGPTCKLGIDASPEAVAIQAVYDNAHNLSTYYTGFGETDRTVAAVLAKTGMTMSEALSFASLGSGSNQKPSAWKGSGWSSGTSTPSGG